MTPSEQAAVAALGSVHGLSLNESQFVKTRAAEPARDLKPYEANYLRRLAAKHGVPGLVPAEAPVSSRSDVPPSSPFDVVTLVPVALCRASPTARKVLPIKVEELVRSISEIGLRQPINVRPLDDGFEIRGGGHRHAAFVALGRDVIPAFVRHDDELRAELTEIDENLIRNDLGPAERAAAIARRKAIYEALHPDAVHGGDRRSSRQVGDLKSVQDRFTSATAKATGKSERSVQRDAHRGESLSAGTLSRLAGTSLDKGDELDALVALDRTAPARVLQLVDRAEAGEKVSAKTALKKDRRATRERDLGAKQRALPDRKYGVILADPEWRFEPWSRETGLDRSADNHYPTSDLDALKARPVGEIAAKDCTLFLWATGPMLPQALEVMAAWGFTYVSQTIWRKAEARPESKRSGGVVLGMGYWFRYGHELLLVGTRGNVPAPAPGEQWPSIIDAPPRKHSEKPDWQYDLIEAYFPNLPRIELNARRARPGWDAWGFEAPEQEPGSSATEDAA